jgi:Endoglucanase
MISIDGPWFKDDLGRTLFLRGVNLGGSSKVPAMPDGATFRKEGFFDHRHVSFVNRPFPLAEADEHFSRLKSWGFNILRFLVTWEAVEHSGPGIYDDEYLAYLRAVIEKAGEYGFIVFIDPHEDVWSRFFRRRRRSGMDF